MLNKVMIVGRLGQDPELRYAQNGTAIASMSVATDESYNDREGNKVERTEWHRVSVFQRQAENCANYLSKGSLVFVEGSLQTRKWQDQNGQDRYTTEIKAQRVQFLDRRGEGDDSQSQQAQQPRPSGRQQQQGNPQPQNTRQQSQQRQAAQGYDGYSGPAFPGEASGLDDLPF